MTIMDLCRAYGYLHHMHQIEVKTEYDAGLITKYELFDAFLKYEGIQGYTDKIISAFRICYELD